MSIAETTTITIRTDKAVKKKAQKLFGDMGLDMSTAMNMFLRKSVEEEAIPFEVSRRPNRKTRKVLKDIEEKKNLVGPFNTVAELMESLNADD